MAFFEKYAKYPDVIRVMLSRYLEVKELNKRLVDAKYLRILDLMPQSGSRYFDRVARVYNEERGVLGKEKSVDR